LPCEAMSERDFVPEKESKCWIYWRFPKLGGTPKSSTIRPFFSIETSGFGVSTILGNFHIPNIPNPEAIAHQFPWLSAAFLQCIWTIHVKNWWCQTCSNCNSIRNSFRIINWL
jgi:hypothetical protein